MIQKLKTKFVILAMAALLVLLATIVTGMNIINYNAIVADADETLEILSQNRGTFPDFDRMNKKLPPHMTVETPYETRFFSVLLDHNGSVIQTDTSRIKAISPETAVHYANTAMQSGKETGFHEDYRFVCYTEDNFSRIIFLDCGRKIYTYHRFLYSSICMAFVGYLAFFIVILFFSGKIMKPVAESYEKQKRFITDAGHEIKTPLAIIKADADVLEMECGENEWVEDIQTQIKRLSGLTADLVYLSRMEESENALPMIEFPFSDVVSETALSFHSMAQMQNKTFLCNVPQMLSYVGNEKAIRQLTNILMDNALKYSPEHGTISLTVRRTARHIYLTVYNTTQEPITKVQLTHLFERFYRADSSRSSKTGGYGIGLSVAQAICASHNGKISAFLPDANSLEITVQLPV